MVTARFGILVQTVNVHVKICTLTVQLPAVAGKDVHALMVCIDKMIHNSHRNK